MTRRNKCALHHSLCPHMKKKKTEYIIEFIVHGRAVKVTAVDPTTGTEAVLVGDIHQPREILSKEAVKKLEYILKK